MCRVRRDLLKIEIIMKVMNPEILNLIRRLFLDMHINFEQFLVNYIIKWKEVGEEHFSMVFSLRYFQKVSNWKIQTLNE